MLLDDVVVKIWAYHNEALIPMTDAVLICFPMILKSQHSISKYSRLLMDGLCKTYLPYYIRHLVYTSKRTLFG